MAKYVDVSELGKEEQSKLFKEQALELKQLRQTLERYGRERRIYKIPVKLKGNVRKIGLISDTHFGSLYQRADSLAEIYSVFKKEGVTDVFHAGDVLEGEGMYKGQVYEIFAHGLDAQLNEAHKGAECTKGIRTHFIVGNHDLSYSKVVGIDVGRLIAEATGWNYLGPNYAMVHIGTEKMPFSLAVMHPSGGTAYALSYKSQKVAESFSGGQKPSLLSIGHFHKSDWMPCYRNIEVYQAGCFQSQTPFMATKPTPAHVGGWIVEITLGKKEHFTSRVKGEFISFYEPGQVE